MELTDGAYALPLTLELDGGERTFTPAVVETERGLLLVDVCLPGTADALAAALDREGLSMADVDAVVLTHHDGDHAGSLAEVVDRTGATVYAPLDEAEFVDGRADPLKGDGERYPPARVDVAFAGDSVFHTAVGPLRAVPTPGHSPGHVSLYAPERRLLLAGDALTAADGDLAGPSEAFTLDPETARESVARLAELDVDATLCFHGGFVDAGDERIADLV